MALFNHLFPYSNLHDINLDWIISIIKSIDPAVIQALQELTPDIIEQVNQKVSEAQAAAIAAQSSASEANTARDNAAASAAEASQDATEAAADAVRAENAKIAVENSIKPVDIQPVASANVKQTTAQQIRRSGNVVTISITGQLSNAAASGDYWTTLYTIPGISLPSDATVSIVMQGIIVDGSVSPTGEIRVVSSVVGSTEKFFTVHVAVITN